LELLDEVSRRRGTTSAVRGDILDVHGKAMIGGVSMRAVEFDDETTDGASCRLTMTLVSRSERAGFARSAA
jgi:hypothetical protein